jgi:NAD+ kinase
LKNLTPNNKRIGLIANPEKAVCRQLLRQAAARIQAAGRQVFADAVTAKLANLKVPVCPTTTKLSEQVDLLMVFGGDGTMLRIAREIAGSKTPMLGINVGGLGFLTDVQAHQLPLALEQVWAGETLLETRPLIEASGHVRGEEMSCIALNDFVITRGALPRLIELELIVDDEVVTRYRGDGVIVCSPTGSTAYSLAAGGAIVNPSAPVFTLTPICPHTLSNRSVIVSLSSVVQVKVLSHRVESVLTADGQSPIPLGVGDCISIRKSRHAIRLLHLAGSSFFGTLRRKLNWVGSHV